MPDKLKEHVRQSIDELLASLPAKERLKGLSAKEVVRALSPETLQELARLLKPTATPPSQALMQTAAAILVPESSLSLSAAAAAELCPSR